MSTTTSSKSVAELRESWRYLLWGGIAVSVLGVLAILAPFLTGIALSIMLGALFVIGALVHVAHAFSAQGWTGSLWQIVLAIVYAVGGIALIANPAVGLATLTVLLIGYFVVSGAVEVVMALRLRSQPRWIWLLVSGALSLLLAVLLWLGFPSTAAWAVGLLVGINLLSTGLAMVGVALSGRATAASTDTERVGTGNL